LPFKSDSGYLSVPPGAYEIEVKVSGSDTVVVREHYVLGAGIDYSSIAIGSAETGIRLMSMGDNLLPRASGTISLRVIHAANSAPAVDVYLGGPFSPVTGADPALVGVPFGAESGHIDIPNGVYQGRVT